MVMSTEDVVDVECEQCNDSIHPDEAYETSYGAKIVCNDCARQCDRCADIGTEDDEWCTVDNYNLWCQSCTENRAYWCESCEEYNSESSYYIQDVGSYWCGGCASDNSIYCEDCDAYFESGCDTCMGSRIIHDYSYRPDAIFYGTEKTDRLYFGMEIEVEAYRNLGEASEYAHQLEDMELAYLKSDGSLSCGFEIVTHPMTHDFFKNQADDFFGVIEKLRSEYKVKSWDTTTCGVHVHISRTGFNGGPHMHRFLNLVYSNQAFYEAIAGRSSSRWAKFDDVDSGEFIGEGDDRKWVTRRSFKNKITHGRSSDRYSAVNTQNRETLEMRIFRGTVNGGALKSYLDLAHASVEYTRTLTVNQVRDGALSTDSFMTYIESNPLLYPELIERMSRLVTPSVRLTGQKVSA